MIGKITKATVERLTAGSVLWDTSLVGFGARKQLRHVHYLLRYRINGYQRFVSIGRHGMWTPDTARKEAQRLLGSLRSGIDPASERARRAETFGAEVERYLESKRASLKVRSITEIHRHLVVYAKPLHSLPLTKIDRRTIALRLAEIEQGSGGPSRNRVRSSLSAFFAWAIREGLTEVNPVSGTGKADEGRGRDRVLTEPELARVLGALGEDDFSDIIRLLVLTGQRREEIGGLRWSEIDWGRGLIVLGPDRVKNKRLHELPMPTQVQAILDRRLDIGNWRLHDLRRSAATHMAELGTLPHVVEAILNHVSGHKSGVAGIYNRARYEGAMREALQAWGDYIDRLTPTGEMIGPA